MRSSAAPRAGCWKGLGPHNSFVRLAGSVLRVGSRGTANGHVWLLSLLHSRAKVTTLVPLEALCGRYSCGTRRPDSLPW